MKKTLEKQLLRKACIPAIKRIYKAIRKAQALIIVLLLCGNAYASEPPKDLWKGLLAEAVSEGSSGMLAVCHCVKNRLEKGLSLGLCGINRQGLDVWIEKNTLPKHRQEAREIVKRVFIDNEEDIVKGATHYEYIEKYGTPYWAKKMRVTAKIGNHTFYK